MDPSRNDTQEGFFGLSAAMMWCAMHQTRSPIAWKTVRLTVNTPEVAPA